MLVQAAEQSGLKADIERTGYEKREWVITEALRILGEHGVTQVDVATIASLIESSLLQGLHKTYGTGILSVPDLSSVPLAISDSAEE